MKVRRSFRPRRLVCVAAAATALGVFGSSTPALGHLEEDQGPQLGEYRVTLVSIKVLPGLQPFRPGEPLNLFKGKHINLLVWSNVLAETHTAQNAIFEIRNAAVGESEPINRLIYWHIDCVPGEKLKPTVKVGVLQPGYHFYQPLEDLLAGGGGIVSDEDGDRPPDLPPTPGVHPDIVNAIRGALGEAVLPTYDVEGFPIPPDSGTHKFGPRGHIKPRASFEIEVTYSYKPLPASKCARQERWAAIKRKVEQDRAVRRIVRGTTDSDGDGHNDRTERACGSNPHDANSTPIYRRRRCVRVRHRRPPRTRPKVTGSATFTSDQSGLAFSAAFSAAINTFEIAVPGGRQVTAVQAPTGFRCRVASFNARSDAYLCRGHLAANTIVQGAIQTNPPPVVGMGGELVGSSGRAWFGAFGVLGPALPPLSCAGQFSTPVQNNNPLNFGGQCNQAIDGIGIVVPGGRQIAAVPSGCSVGTTTTPSDTLLCPGSVPANQPIQLQTATNPPPATGMGGRFFVVQGSAQSNFFTITGP